MDNMKTSSKLLTLTAFAYESSKALYQLVSSFENHGRSVRQLKEEVEALSSVLGSLHYSLDQNELNLSALELPIQRCGKACQELTKVIRKCTATSQEPQTSFRDWFRISYLGKDIAGFTNLVAGYKATITIALSEINLRTTRVTADLLREYKAMIGFTTSDLEDIMQDLEARMRDPKPESTGVPDQAIVSMTDIEEERASIQQCLDICMHFSAHIDEVQSQSLAGMATPSVNDGSAVVVDKPKLAHLLTSESLQDCKRGLSLTTLELQTLLRDAERRLKNALRQEQELGGTQDYQRITEDLNSVKKCLSIYAEAAEENARRRVNVFEDVSMGDDGHQITVSTMGDLISAERVTIGSRSTQWLGQISDATIQQLSRDHSYPNAIPDEQAQVVTGTIFENRHATGRNLG